MDGCATAESLECAAPGSSTDASAKAASYDRLVDAPAMFGKLYESSFQQDGATYHVVVDSPDVDLRALQGMLRKITAAQWDWMQDRPYDEYTFLYLVAHGSGGGGMEHAYSTAIDVGADRLKQDVLSVSGISAHEFFHLWNVKRIRPQSLEPVDYTREQYSRALWFSEGVTSTVADILRDARGTLRREASARASGLGDRRGAVAQRPAHAIGRGVQPGYMVRPVPELSPRRSAASPTIPRARYSDFSSTLKCAA